MEHAEKMEVIIPDNVTKIVYEDVAKRTSTFIVNKDEKFTCYIENNTLKIYRDTKW
jgi:hypothetical protein